MVGLKHPDITQVEKLHQLLIVVQNQTKQHIAMKSIASSIYIMILVNIMMFQVNILKFINE